MQTGTSLFLWPKCSPETSPWANTRWKQLRSRRILAYRSDTTVWQIRSTPRLYLSSSMTHKLIHNTWSHARRSTVNYIVSNAYVGIHSWYHWQSCLIIKLGFCSYFTVDDGLLYFKILSEQQLGVVTLFCLILWTFLIVIYLKWQNIFIFCCFAGFKQTY